MKKSDLNILIIEDDPTLRTALAEAIKRKGYRSVAVAKPDEAESFVKIKPVHILISDVMLPGRNGVDLVVKLKENLMESTGIFFISGIYKDRMFKQEAIKKTDAVEFFEKPFDMNKFIDVVEKKINEFMDTPKVDLHNLLASPFASNRERKKAIDRIESMTGFDLPFLVCIYMDAQTSGHLNIIDQEQNIYGITFVNGAILKVDSEFVTASFRNILIQNGYISEEDLNSVKSQRGDLIKTLVEQGLISPHVPAVVKSETIIGELKKLLSDKTLQINFVPDRKLEADGEVIEAKDFISNLHDMVSYSIPITWLKKFYSLWMGHPIRLGPQFSDFHQYAHLPLIKNTEGLIELCKKESTIEEIIVNSPNYSEENIFKSLHFLMLKRVLVFEEAKRVKNIDEHINRLKSMYNELKNKNPFEIFKYFGLGDNPKTADVIRIYKEFAKTHHPDALTKHVQDEIKKLNHELFSQVTAAYEIFSNPDKKEKYLSEIKQKEAEAQIKSDDLVNTALSSLNRGRYSEALPLLQSAVKFYENERSLLHFWWAKFKVEGQMNEVEVNEIENKMKAMSTSLRKTATWLFVNGLIRKYKGDLRQAQLEFTKVLQIDSEFMDARRELANIKNTSQKEKSANETILTGDISNIFKGIFSKKKGA